MSALLSAIRERLAWGDHVSFAELSQIDGFNGDLSLSLDDNLVVWAGMSREACDALETIRREGEYILIPTSPMTYMFDGAALSLPLAKRPRAYKTPHWAPCVLSRRYRRRSGGTT
jgi:hypothetical protein